MDKIRESKTDFIIVGIWTLLLSAITISCAAMGLNVPFSLTTWGAVEIGIALMWLITRFGLFTAFRLRQSKRREAKLLAKEKIKQNEVKWEKLSVQDREKQLSQMSKLPLYIMIGIGALILIIGFLIK